MYQVEVKNVRTKVKSSALPDISHMSELALQIPSSAKHRR